MKNIRQKLFSILAFALAGFITSCGEDDSVTAALPSVTVAATTGDGSALASGGDLQATDSIAFTVSITAPGGFNTLDVTGGTTITVNRNDLGLDAGTTSASYSFKIFTTESQENQSGSLSFVVTDEIGQQSESLTFEFSITEAPSPDAIVYTGILVAPPLGNADSKTFYSISGNQLYSHNDVTGTNDPVSANIDLGYYYGTMDNASLAAPASYPANVFDISAWGTKNDTQLVSTTMSSEDYMGLTSVDDVTEAITNITFDANIVTGLAVGNILAFKTAATSPISGFIMVKAINGTDGENDSIELEFVLDQPVE